MKKTIAYITDIHLDEPFVLDNGADPRTNWKTILDDVRKRKIDSLILGGDIGAPSANAWFFKSLHSFHIDITLGNHDTFIEVRKHYNKEEWKEKTEGYYAKEDTYFKFVFLDTSKDALHQPQLAWLAESLITEKPVILFVHHPILAVETIVDKAYPLQDREQVKQLLINRKKDTFILSGHYHTLDESVQGSIQQYVTPAASYQIVKETKELTIDASAFGYRLIHFNEDKFSTEVIWFTKDNA